MAKNRETMPPKYSAFGKIETDLDGEHFSGDFVFAGDDESFSVEIYAFGTIVLKAEEENGRVIYYYLGNKYDERSIPPALLPVKFNELKGLLIDVSKGKSVDIDGGTFTARTVIEGKTRLIHIKDYLRGEIKITVEDEK